MEQQEVQLLIQEIVNQTKELKEEYLGNKEVKIQYVCIFSQSKEEYEKLEKISKQMGTILAQTKTGNLYQIPEMKTALGNLRILKIRIPDKTRPERGDADFKIEQYEEFKKENSNKENFKLIVRENFEMIELMDSRFKVRVYFSNPPVEQQYHLK